MFKKLLTTFALVCLLFFLGLIPILTKPALAAGCTYNGSSTAASGSQFTITYNGFAAGENIWLVDRLGGTTAQVFGTTQDSLSGSKTDSFTFNASSGGYSVLIQTRFPIVNFVCGNVDISGSGGGGIGGGLFGTKIILGNFFSPAGAFANLGELASRIIIILTSFVGAASLFFIVISGIKFVTSSGDPKQIASARATLTYAMIGLSVAILAFVILQVVQYFLGASVPI